MKWEKNWMKPVWESDFVFRETFAMIEENGVCSANFLYKPDEILKVESYDGTRQYEMGKDFVVEENRIILTKESAIPSTNWEWFYHSTEEEAMEGLKHTAIPLNWGPLATTDGRFLNLSAIANSPFITDWQIAVTYTSSEKWAGECPQSASDKLPKFFEKVKTKEEVTIVLYGDSISYGFDCSGICGLEPHQPIWSKLVKNSLEEFYGIRVNMVNPSASGMNTDWAIEHAVELIKPCVPDLVILGYGMNDRCPGEEYAEKTRKLRAVIKEACPDTELIMIATTLPNKLVHTAPFHFDAYQDEYSQWLKTLEETGTAIANVQEIQREMEKRKRYIDITGNNLNHPNDYLARIHAQVITTLLS